MGPASRAACNEDVAQRGRPAQITCIGWPPSPVVVHDAAVGQAARVFGLGGMVCCLGAWIYLRMRVDMTSSRLQEKQLYGTR